MKMSKERILKLINVFCVILVIALIAVICIQNIKISPDSTQLPNDTNQNDTTPADTTPADSEPQDAEISAKPEWQKKLDDEFAAALEAAPSNSEKNGVR